jgi:hypothetical protein
MSDTSSNSKPSATFFWVLMLFFGFAVFFYLVQALFVRGDVSDPRSGERVALASEVHQAEADLLNKMGLSDESKRAAIFEKTLMTLKSKKPTASQVVVPGSATQLQQMQAVPAAPAGEAAPSGDASTPADAAAPTTN